MRTTESGFTLIELMVVVAIVGTLAALAIPAYQDYTIRAQVAEGITLAAGAKAAISEFVSENGSWPKKNKDAGLADKKDIRGKYTDEIKVKKDGVIEIKYGSDAHTYLNKKKLKLIATTVAGSVEWDCISTGKAKDKIDRKYLPAACR